MSSAICQADLSDIPANKGPSAFNLIKHTVHIINTGIIAHIDDSVETGFLIFKRIASSVLKTAQNPVMMIDMNRDADALFGVSGQFRQDDSWIQAVETAARKNIIAIRDISIIPIIQK